MAKKATPLVVSRPPDGQMAEIGVAGLRVSSGYVWEEFLNELRGSRGQRIYREMSSNDATVGAVLNAIGLIIRAVNWTAVPANDSAKAEEEAQFADSLLVDMSHSFEDFISECLTMLQYGWSYFEMVLKRRIGPQEDDSTRRSDYDDGLIGVRKLAPRGQDSLLRWDMQLDGGINGMVQLPLVGGPQRFLPIDRCLLFRTLSRKNNPEGVSILRTAYRYWYDLKNIEMFEAIGIERELCGLPVMRLPSKYLSSEATDAEKLIRANCEKIVRDLRFNEQAGVLLGSDTWLDHTGSPSSTYMMDLQLLSSSGQRAINTDVVIQRKQRGIARSMLADFVMLGEGSGTARGSYGMHESKVDLFIRACETILRQITYPLNKFMLPRIWAYNNKNFDLMPEYKPGKLVKADLAALGTFIRDLSQAGEQLFPDDDLSAYLRDEANLPEKSPEAQALQEQMNQPPPGTSGTPGTPGTPDTPNDNPDGGGPGPPGNGRKTRKIPPDEATFEIGKGYNPNQQRVPAGQHGGGEFGSSGGGAVGTGGSSGNSKQDFQGEILDRSAFGADNSKASLDEFEGRINDSNLSDGDKKGLLSQVQMIRNVAASSGEKVNPYKLSSREMKEVDAMGDDNENVEVNDVLRNDKALSKSMKSRIKALDSSFSKVSLKDNVSLYRGVYGKGADQLALLKPGAIFSDKSYPFFSDSQEEASRYATSGGKGDHSLIIQFEGQKGDRIISPDYSANSVENAYLLPRDAKFEVISNDRKVLRAKWLSLVGKAYNPDEARDADGKWTSSGVSETTRHIELTAHPLSQMTEEEGAGLRWEYDREYLRYGKTAMPDAFSSWGDFKQKYSDAPMVHLTDAQLNKLEYTSVNISKLPTMQEVRGIIGERRDVSAIRDRIMNGKTTPPIVLRRGDRLRLLAGQTRLFVAHANGIRLPVKLIDVGDVTKEWDESKHPRVPAGEAGGGQFGSEVGQFELAPSKQSFQNEIHDKATSSGDKSEAALVDLEGRISNSNLSDGDKQSLFDQVQALRESKPTAGQWAGNQTLTDVPAIAGVTGGGKLTPHQIRQLYVDHAKRMESFATKFKESGSNPDVLIAAEQMQKDMEALKAKIPFKSKVSIASIGSGRTSLAEMQGIHLAETQGIKPNPIFPLPPMESVKPGTYVSSSGQVMGSVTPNVKPGTTKPLSSEPAVSAAEAHQEAANIKWVTAESAPLVKNELGSITSYTDGSDSINSLLRGGHSSSIYTANHVVQIDSAMAKSTITVPTTVYRGLKEEFVKHVNVGKVVMDHGFVSTSKKLSNAIGFASATSGTKFVAEISLKPGQTAIDLYGRSSYPSEQEVLLPRGKMFRILEISGNSKLKTVKMEML